MESRWDVTFAARATCFFLSASLPALVALTTAPAADAAGSAPGWPPIPEQAWQEKARPDSGGRDAIVLFEDGEVQDREGEYRCTIFRRIRLLTEKGREAGKVEVDVLKGVKKVQDIRARSVRPGGVITELAPDQILTTTILKSGGAEYSRATFIVPGMEPGCVVEYRYTLSGKYESTWTWVWYFQNEYYTCESRFRWRPSEWARAKAVHPQWAFKRIAESRVEGGCAPTCDQPKEVSFAARAIPGRSQEPWAPPLPDGGPRVVTSYVPYTMGPLDFWSLWKHALDEVAGEFGKNLGGLGKVIEQAQARRSDPEQALGDVYRWLQANVRSSAELSWSDLQAGSKERSFWRKESSVADLIKHGAGSPYEINLAFSSAAQKLGFEACVVLVRDRREGTFDYNLISWPPSEPITAVRPKGGRKWRYYDPASRFEVEGSVPWYLRGGSGLIAGSGQQLFLSVEAEDGAPGDAHWRLDLTLDGSGSLEGRVAGALRGEEGRASRARLWVENPAQWADLLERQLVEAETPKLELAPPVVRPEPDSAFFITGTIRYPSLAAVSGSTMSLPLEGLAPWRFHGEFTGDRRTQNVCFNYARHETLSVDLHLPAGAAVEDLPEPRRFANGLGAWETRLSRTPSGLRYQRIVELRFAEILPRDYGMVREFFAPLEEADRELLLVRKP